MPSTESTGAWRTPLVVLIAGALILFFSIGVRSSFGIFLGPMTLDLGWPRETFAFAIALQNLVWGMAQPVTAAIADRFGAARTIAIGALIYAAGVYAMAAPDSAGAFYFSAGLLVGLGLTGTGTSVVLGAIARAVPAASRSRALGIATACGSLGQFAMAVVSHGLLAAADWSAAFIALSMLALLVLPLAVALRSPAEPAGGTSPQRLRDAFAEAFRHRGYWFLTSGFFVCGFHVAFVATHLPAYVSDAGLDPATGAVAIAVIGLFNVVGSYLAGELGGRYSKKRCLSTLYALRAGVMLGFLVVPISTASVLAFAAAMGLLWLSTVPLTSGLVGQIFGVRYLSTLFSVVFVSHQLGSFFGVWLGGRVFDMTGSYELVWIGAVALGLASSVLHLPIDERALRAESA